MSKAKISKITSEVRTVRILRQQVRAGERPHAKVAGEATPCPCRSRQAAKVPASISPSASRRRAALAPPYTPQSQFAGEGWGPPSPRPSPSGSEHTWEASRTAEAGAWHAPWAGREQRSSRATGCHARDDEAQGGTVGGRAA